MALQRQAISINFQSGVETKVDPLQLAVGKFVDLQNSVFDTLGRLTKRKGFDQMTALPSTSRYLTTYNGNLTAIGSNLFAYISPNMNWVNKGQLQPVDLDVLPMVRNNTNQSMVDSVIAPNGLVCVTYVDNITAGSVTASVSKYTILDSTTGQSVVPPTQIVTNFGSAVYGPKVFLLQSNFILVFAANSASAYHLQYVPVNVFNPTTVGSSTDVSTSFTPSSQGAFDGVVANNKLYLSWNGASNSGLKTTTLNQSLTVATPLTIASSAATIVSVTADTTQTTPVVYSSFYVVGTNSGYVTATDQNLVPLFSAVQIVSSSTQQVSNIASAALNGYNNVYTEHANVYTHNSVPTNFVNKTTVTQTGSASGLSSLKRGLGLGSKAFALGNDTYILGSYQSTYQPTYFLINSSSAVVAKLAYQNGGGYLTQGLPSVSVIGSSASVGYLVKSLIQAVNKDTATSSTTQTTGIYSQTGINLAKFTFGQNNISSAETGNNLNINGGFLWSYDGQTPVEQNFFLYPEDVGTSPGVSGGSMSMQQYYYRCTYEWSDNQGNLFRSAPSVPVGALTTSSANTNVCNIFVPTLRLTYKTANPVKIVIYRWSAAQQNYYQVTSITTPIENSPSADSIVYTDYKADSVIIGNSLLYTTGGVIENINGPSARAVTLFDNRLWLVDSENPNQLWFSKQVLQSTPVEMSDLLTMFVPPSTVTGVSTGSIKCISAMDDKLIIFKQNAIYYVNGQGPDDTGANNQYSPATFITATVGCSTQNSIASIPSGLIFKSDKGIWLLGRDLSTSYIGAPVERYNSNEVLSALSIPGTNQVRISLDNGIVLLYDYLVNQWGYFTGISNLSSTIYNGVHTFINRFSQVFSESATSYLDGSSPVLMSFKTGWLNLAGLQGYQRTYRCYMLGEYKTPHKLTCGVAYDYDSSIVQTETITPTNYSSPWGVSSPWGSSEVWGGPSAREQWQINFQRQQCQSFQLTFNEYFDATVASVSAGAGLTISGLNIVAGVKKSYPRNLAAKAKV